MQLRSELLEFDQGSAAILRVQKKDRLAMRTNFWVFVAKNAHASPLQLFARGNNVGDLETKMMDRAARVLGQKFRDGGMRTQWFDQLDLGVQKLHKNHR